MLEYFSITTGCELKNKEPFCLIMHETRHTISYLLIKKF